MIVTVTPNPSIDRTVALGTPLVRGAVHRVTSATGEPGGKGVNVARALALAGVDTVAVLPAGEADPMLVALSAAGVAYRTVPSGGAVRTNLTITEADGTTTKLNEPGAPLDASALQALTRTVLEYAETASWIVLSGSLPPGVPDRWYADVVAQLATAPCRVAVDTSERPLDALAAAFGDAAPDVIKPNAEELAGLVGASPAELEVAAAEGDPTPVVAAASQLVERGIRTVLVTLGAAGAVLVDPSGSWWAAPPPISPRSTVGAGDSALAGYLRAAVGGAEPPRRLQMAVAYGSAAAALPGSALPAPSQIDLNAVRVHAITPAPTRP
ncbi:1-phosphofructokinase [Mycolicibacterium madagascariense]|uniref:1-phosphofructokinase n=1 Tax=Mycolicibacterium madagascariense TaxID=212765 RepID=A0A7I7XP78_9MYCO|nr:1-phosphofructokinase family hexose kinase [Mycolicibacterium madagascariense]MCV7014032.1 1-phosphofructokinase family hexose kinase [Mycolicibacterium madagascariense]BBZ31057.1 1-phosphofructokinase [Mycolicibacterium madagascariense]